MNTNTKTRSKVKKPRAPARDFFQTKSYFGQFIPALPSGPFSLFHVNTKGHGLFLVLLFSCFRDKSFSSQFLPESSARSS